MLLAILIASITSYFTYDVLLGQNIKDTFFE
ncbi:MAG: hypothetical protein QOD75_1588 [Blastocatellia bacterium]|nr:hypothetical protein [Blastocatellia bacterium]